MDNQVLSRLKEFIKNRGWTQKEFADRVGIHHSNVRHYLVGKLDYQKLLYRLSQEGCDVNWLLTGNDNEAYRKQLEDYEKKIKEVDKYADKIKEIIK